MLKVSVHIYEQEMFGQTHYRVMRTDGRLILEQHQVDFGTEDEAIAAIQYEFHRNRNKQEEPRIFAHRLDRQANGRNAKTVEIKETNHVSTRSD